jgi:hypothetical protein
MKALAIDNTCRGIYLVYDVETGEVLWTHEDFIEIANDDNRESKTVTEYVQRETLSQAQEVFSNKKLGIIAAPQEFSLQENMSVSIDINNKSIVERKVELPSLAERLSEQA